MYNSYNHARDLGFRSPFNGKNNCWSAAGMGAFEIPEIDGVNQLTNRKDRSFTIIELEVWKVLKSL